MYLEQFFVEGLGHASYLIASEGSHEAAVIDPRRDVQVYRDAAARIGATLRYALETHDHNDFVSGARILSEADGVEVIASATAGCGRGTSWYSVSSRSVCSRPRGTRRSM